MSIKNHLMHYWPHYSFGSIMFWLSGGLEKVWDNTEWLRGILGLVKKDKKKKKRKVRRK